MSGYETTTDRQAPVQPLVVSVHLEGAGKPVPRRPLTLWGSLYLAIIFTVVLVALSFTLRGLEQKVLDLKAGEEETRVVNGQSMASALNRRFLDGDTLAFVGLSLLWMVRGAVEAAAALCVALLIFRAAMRPRRRPPARATPAARGQPGGRELLLVVLVCVIALMPYTLAFLNDGRLTGRELSLIWQQGLMAAMVGGALGLIVWLGIREEARKLSLADQAAFAAAALAYAQSHQAARACLVTLDLGDSHLQPKEAFVRLDEQSAALVESLDIGARAARPTYVEFRDPQAVRQRMNSAVPEATFKALVKASDPILAAARIGHAEHHSRLPREQRFVEQGEMCYQLVVKRRATDRFVEVRELRQTTIVAGSRSLKQPV